jgi:hypothetical protein
MPLGRGENIGQAYVRITADGSEVGDGIREGFRDQDGLIEAEGNRHSTMYSKAWEKGLKSQTNRTRLQKALAKGLADADLLEHFLKGKGWTDFKAGLERQYDLAGKRAAASLEQGLASGMTHEELRKRVENMNALLDQTDREYHRDREAAWREHHARLGRQAAEVFSTLAREIPQLRVGDRRAMSKDDLRRDLRELAEDMERAGVATKDSRDRINDFDLELRRTHPTLGRFINNIDLFADRSSRAFGRGSRSEFLNFIGSLARGMIQVMSLPVRLARGLANLGPAIAEAGGGFSGFIKVMGRGAAGGIAALGAFTLVLGPLISMLSLAAGAVIGLASSLTMALIGALGAVGGAIVPFAAGIGVAVAAFSNLDGEAKRAADSVGRTFKDLGKAAGEGLQFDNGRLAQNFRDIRGMVESLEPVTRQIGRGISNVFDRFADGAARANSPWRQFVNAITGGGREVGWMQTQVERLGDSMSNTFGGLLGMFRGLMPTIDRFTAWLEETTGDFEKWANSVKGQQEIRKFFDDAADSARDFGSFLSGVWDLLGTVITLGNGAGDSMFRSLGDKARELAAWLNTPQGAAAFKEWMNDAREFAEALGTLVVGVGKFVAAVDNDVTRALGKFSIGAMTAPFRAMAFAIDYVTAAFDWAVGGIRKFAGVLGDLLAKLPAMAGMKGVARDLQAFARGSEDSASAAEKWANSSARMSAQMRALTGDLKGVPKRVETVFEQKGIPESMKGLQKLFRQQNLSKGEIKSIINVLGAEEAWRKYLKTQREAKKTDKEKSNPKVDLNTLQFDKAMKATLRKILEMDKQKPTPKGDLNPTAFNAKMSAAFRLLRDIGNDVARPRIDVQSNAQAVAAGTRAILNSISDEVVNIFTVKKPKGAARGTIANFPQIREIGEAGAEAVVPLNRPLSQVDPAVRWLSAIAQGKVPAMASGGVVGGGRTVNVGGVTVVSPSSDPRAVAVETVNYLVAVGY